MISKESLNVFLVNIYKKCDTPQEKRLLECISYDLNALIDEAQLQKKHFEKEIRNLKYVRARPKIEALETEIKNLEEKNFKLEVKIKDKDAECKAYQRRIKRLNKIFGSDLYKKELLKQLNHATARINQYKSDLSDIEKQLDNIERYINGGKIYD